MLLSNVNRAYNFQSPKIPNQSPSSLRAKRKSDGRITHSCSASLCHKAPRSIIIILSIWEEPEATERASRCDGLQCPRVAIFNNYINYQKQIDHLYSAEHSDQHTANKKSHNTRQLPHLHINRKVRYK